MNIKRENLRTMKGNKHNTCKIPIRCPGKRSNKRYNSNERYNGRNAF